MVSKKKPVKRTPAKKSSKKKAKSKFPISWMWLFQTSLKLCLVLVTAVFVYGIYLDSKIRKKMDGQIWSLPAQIYARPLTLYPGLEINKSEVVQELKLLNYRYVKKPRRAGEYAQSKTRLEIVRRGFDFRDGPEPDRRILVTFSGKTISEIKLVDENKKMGYVRLEPLLIDRLSANNAEDRMMVRLEDTPSLLVETLLLVEDRQFYHHKGVSLPAIGRALVANIKAGQTVQGGSTLTQQLAKNIFLSRQRSLIRKLQEAYMALIIDFRYNKDTIIEAYLNEVYLGQNGANGVYGFGLASQFYFGRPIGEISASQIAHLVALVKGPSYYDPWRSPERSLARRDLILRLMANNDLIDEDTYNSEANHDVGVIKRGAMKKQTAPAFLSLVRRELREKVGDEQLIQSGVRVFTSLDPVAQKSAEEALHYGIKEIEKARKLSHLEGAIVVTDKRKGEIIALVGGRDVKYAGFNRAMDAVRPIGSLVKPAVYLTALAGKFNLASRLKDKPIRLKNNSGSSWSPKNYDKKYRGEVSLHQSLTDSLNVPTVNLGLSVGIDNVVKTLNRMGIEKQINAYPSLVLGSLSLSPLQIAQMYQTLVSQGRYQPLVTIRAVTDGEGMALYEKSERAEQVLPADASYLTLYNLEQVTEIGTARSLTWRLPGYQFGGKTGTTDELRDSWFVGWDNRDLVSVWVGRDDNKPAGLTGSAGAVPIFAKYMKQRQPKSSQLSAPSSVVKASFIKATGQQAEENCEGIETLPVARTHLVEPKTCSIWTNPFASSEKEEEPKEKKRKNIFSRFFD
ncbi:penicillin-binding protein 1B [Motilimonas pumila]|uniref:Penicillin-binding protein 1B n=1 Tax=Motilimonas pumila TaxID=2303987 RepID=A0A418YC30_9GAMM|nr:penicillin-binding protein 1B [Motilimonas pumila]RJG42080.1 penicillin-binding protein 1B [Motilimonas pumila]